jgi:transcription initiation factor TFIID subunit 13
MRLRQKGQQFSNPEREYRLDRHYIVSLLNLSVAGLLEAFGDTQPLPATLTTLDEIITDFIIETCHSAAICASYSRRQKIKVDDFKWVLRRDAKKLGRVTEIFFAEKILKDNRKAFDIGTGEGLVAGKKGAVKELGVEEEGEEGGRKKKKRKTEA